MPTKKPSVKLSDTDGNVFSLLSLARRAARKAGWTETQWDAVFTEATSGDYDQVLQTLMKHFEVS